MQNYLSGRGANIEESTEEDSGTFSSYLSDPSKQQPKLTEDDSGNNSQESETEVLHQDESGIKVEVVSVDGSPINILIHIPDGRIIDLGCEY